MLTIRDRVFDLSSATFGAILSLDEDSGWRFEWSFEFKTIGRKFDDQTWQPRLYAESLELSLPAPESLPGYTLKVADAYDKYGEPNFSLCVFEHEAVYDVRIDFGYWHGDAIELTLNGLGDVHWDEEYGTAVPLQIECRAVFEGINVFDHSEESARSRLSAFYDPTRFLAEKSHIGFTYRLRSHSDG